MTSLASSSELRDSRAPKLSFDWVTDLDAQDAEGMLRILNEVAETTGTNGFSEPLTGEQASDLIDRLRDALRSGTAHQLIVRMASSGAVVGIATLYTMSQPARKHIVEIRRAAIDLRNRGRFLKLAWNAIVARCREMRWEVIQIDVSEDGPVALWEHFGFRTFGRIDDYARIGERKLEGVFMAYTVERAPHLLPGK